MSKNNVANQNEYEIITDISGYKKGFTPIPNWMIKELPPVLIGLWTILCWYTRTGKRISMRSVIDKHNVGRHQTTTAWHALVERGLLRCKSRINGIWELTAEPFLFDGSLSVKLKKPKPKQKSKPKTQSEYLPENNDESLILPEIQAEINSEHMFAIAENQLTYNKNIQTEYIKTENDDISRISENCENIAQNSPLPDDDIPCVNRLTFVADNAADAISNGNSQNVANNRGEDLNIGNNKATTNKKSPANKRIALVLSQTDYLAFRELMKKDISPRTSARLAKQEYAKRLSEGYLPEEIYAAWIAYSNSYIACHKPEDLKFIKAMQTFLKSDEKWAMKALVLEGREALRAQKEKENKLIEQRALDELRREKEEFVSTTPALKEQEERFHEARKKCSALMGTAEFKQALEELGELGRVFEAEKERLWAERSANVRSCG